MRKTEVSYGIAGALIAWVGWIGFDWPALTILLPVLWREAPSRLAAFSLLSTYYAVGANCLTQSAYGFFGVDSYPITLGIFMWISASLLNAAPLALLWRKDGSAAESGGRFVLAIIFNTIPPLGMIGWLNPALGASSIVPGYAGLSVMVGVTLMATVAAFGRVAAPVVFASLIASQLIVPTPTEVPRTWNAVESSWGKPPENSKEELKRRIEIVSAAEKSFQDGATTLFMPENIAGQWSDSHEVFYRSYLSGWLSRGRVLVIGATTWDGDQLHNSLIALTGEGTQQINARQVVPVSMWHPWSEYSFAVDWSEPSLLHIDGKKVHVSICYEDFLFPLALLGYYRHAPDVMLSVANAWWSPDSGEIEIQKRHAEVTARVLGLPLIRSINFPQTHDAR